VSEELEESVPNKAFIFFLRAAFEADTEGTTLVPRRFPRAPLAFPLELPARTSTVAAATCPELVELGGSSSGASSSTARVSVSSVSTSSADVELALGSGCTLFAGDPDSTVSNDFKRLRTILGRPPGRARGVFDGTDCPAAGHSRTCHCTSCCSSCCCRRSSKLSKRSAAGVILCDSKCFPNGVITGFLPELFLALFLALFLKGDSGFALPGVTSRLVLAAGSGCAGGSSSSTIITSTG